MKHNSVIKAAALLILTALLISLCACAGGQNATETEAPAETGDDWDRATKIWVANTEPSFELRVRPGNFYDLTPDEDEDNQGCFLLADNGNSFHLLVQGLDYEKDFDVMVEYFKGKNPQKLSVGKETKAIITVYDEENIEIVCRLDGMTCLTIIAPDQEAVEDLLAGVMLRFDGEDYTALVKNEKYEKII